MCVGRVLVLVGAVGSSAGNAKWSDECVRWCINVCMFVAYM